MRRGYQCAITQIRTIDCTLSALIISSIRSLIKVGELQTSPYSNLLILYNSEFIYYLHFDQ